MGILLLTPLCYGSPAQSLLALSSPLFQAKNSPPTLLIWTTAKVGVFFGGGEGRLFSFWFFFFKIYFFSEASTLAKLYYPMQLCIVDAVSTWDRKHINSCTWDLFQFKTGKTGFALNSPPKIFPLPNGKWNLLAIVCYCLLKTHIFR